MKLITWPEFKLAYYDVAVNLIRHFEPPVETLSMFLPVFKVMLSKHFLPRLQRKIRGSFNKFPDFYRMGTFIDSTHMKL